MATVSNNIKKARRAEKRRMSRFGFFSLGIGIDIPLLIIILTLLAFGLIMLFSASFAIAYYETGDSYKYIRQQSIYAAFGLAVMFALSLVDYRNFYRLAWVVYGVSTIFLLIVLVDTFALSQGVAQRWISLGPISFQPSELAKFAIIVILAYLTSKYDGKVKTLKYGVVPCFGVTFITAGLIVAEKHVSATIIVAILACIIMFIGGIQFRWFAILGGLGTALLLVVILTTDVFAYVIVRIQGWLNPFNPPDGVDTWQTVQSIYAIGSGEIFGVGLGQSRQKYSYLPEAQNDFIFSIICEELGFIGALLVIGLFIALVWRGMVVSINAKDKFGMLLGLGMTFIVGIQAAFNICVVTNAFPNTGITLPFFSYGGTALIVTLGEMGVLLAVSRHSNTEKI
ncbi:MAG: putative peptidoglycan glycosyltransferase FtsW [Clostridia bacterium]